MPSKSCKIKEGLQNHDGVELNSVVGEGGFGLVVSATLTKFSGGNKKQQVAIKCINKRNLFEHSTGLAMLVGEINALARIGQHNYLADLKYSYQDERTVYLVMALKSCGDLRYFLKKRVLFHEDDLIFMMACLVSALEYIHSKNVFHRDIKPENIILDDRGFPYLTDFGVAYVHDPKVTGKKQLSCDLASGTRQYLAPEVFLNAHIHGPESHYWSLAVVLYELVYLVRPFDKHVPVIIVKYLEDCFKRQQETGHAAPLSICSGIFGSLLSSSTKTTLPSVISVDDQNSNITTSTSTSSATSSTNSTSNIIIESGKVDKCAASGSARDPLHDKILPSSLKLPRKDIYDIPDAKKCSSSNSSSNLEFLTAHANYYTANYWKELSEYPATFPMPAYLTILIPARTSWNRIVSKELTSFLKGVFHIMPAQRLGCKNIDKLMKHELFSDINWEGIEAKTVEPKFKPPQKPDSEIEESIRKLNAHIQAEIITSDEIFDCIPAEQAGMLQDKVNYVSPEYAIDPWVSAFLDLNNEQRNAGIKKGTTLKIKSICDHRPNCQNLASVKELKEIKNNHHVLAEISSNSNNKYRELQKQYQDNLNFHILPSKMLITSSQAVSSSLKSAETDQQTLTKRLMERKSYSTAVVPSTPRGPGLLSTNTKKDENDGRNHAFGGYPRPLVPVEKPGRKTKVLLQSTSQPIFLRQPDAKLNIEVRSCNEAKQGAKQTAEDIYGVWTARNWKIIEAAAYSKMYNSELKILQPKTLSGSALFPSLIKPSTTVVLVTRAQALAYITPCECNHPICCLEIL